MFVVALWMGQDKVLLGSGMGKDHCRRQFESVVAVAVNFRG